MQNTQRALFLGLTLAATYSIQSSEVILNKEAKKKFRNDINFSIEAAKKIKNYQNNNMFIYYEEVKEAIDKIELDHLNEKLKNTAVSKKANKIYTNVIQKNSEYINSIDLAQLTNNDQELKKLLITGKKLLTNYVQENSTIQVPHIENKKLSKEKKLKAFFIKNANATKESNEYNMAGLLCLYYLKQKIEGYKKDDEE